MQAMKIITMNQCMDEYFNFIYMLQVLMQVILRDQVDTKVWVVILHLLGIGMLQE